MGNPAMPSGPPGVTPPSEVPPGLRAVPKPEPDAASPAELAAKQSQAMHTEIAKALAEDPAGLLMSLPTLYGKAIVQMVEAGVSAALEKFPQRSCSVCGAQQATWVLTHKAELDAAEAAAAAAGAPGGVIAFLRADLRPGAGPDALPVVGAEDYLIAGTGYCRAHIPGLELADRQAAVVRKPILLAPMPLNNAMIREAGGVPGVFASAGLAGVPAG